MVMVIEYLPQNCGARCRASVITTPWPVAGAKSVISGNFAKSVGRKAGQGFERQDSVGLGRRWGLCESARRVRKCEGGEGSGVCD